MGVRRRRERHSCAPLKRWGTHLLGHWRLAGQPLEQVGVLHVDDGLEL